MDAQCDLEQPLSADAAADAPLLAHSAVQVEVQGQVLACIELVACFHNGAVALQGGSGSTTAVDGCLSVAATNDNAVANGIT